MRRSIDAASTQHRRSIDTLLSSRIGVCTREGEQGDIAIAWNRGGLARINAPTGGVKRMICWGGLSFVTVAASGWQMVPLYGSGAENLTKGAS